MLAATFAPSRGGPAQASETSRDDDLRAIAEDAYVYAYPLVLLDETMRVGTNVPAPRGQHAPLNQFARIDVLPDARFTTVVLPNVDTLYTSAILDLKAEPIVLHVPDMHGRYYLMRDARRVHQRLRLAGKRTTGTAAHDFAIVGPGLAAAVASGRDAASPRRPIAVWILGRTQINGKEDLPAVTAMTSRYTMAPLSATAAVHGPRNDSLDPSRLDMTHPAAEDRRARSRR